jgi:hypothetical protein
VVGKDVPLNHILDLTDDFLVETFLGNYVSLNIFSY